MHISVASLHGSPAPLHGCTPIRLNWHSLVLTSLLLPSRHHPAPGPQGSPLASPAPLLSFFWHFGSFCHLRGPAECCSASVAQAGVPKVPAGPYVYIHKGPEYFLISQRHIAMLSVRRIVWISLQHDFHNWLRCRFCSGSPVFIRLYAGCENHLKYIQSFLPVSWVYCMFHLYLFWPHLCKKKKKLNKVSSHFSVIYSARILGELIFFSPFASSLCLCERAELCVRSVGCL